MKPITALIKHVVGVIQRRRTARQMRVAQERAWATELNELHYDMIYTCLKNLVQAIDSTAIDDLRVRRTMLNASKDILVQVRTPVRPSPNYIEV